MANADGIASAPLAVAQQWSWWLRAGLALIVVVAIVLALRWASGSSEPEHSIAHQWNDSIQRLGIEPVYPPVEDLAVGDVLVMIADDAVRDISGEPFAGRSIKLLHLDLTAEIESTYRQLYQFPETSPRPAADQAWTQAASAESLFKPPTVRARLPIVLFPAFSITQTRRTNASTGNLAELWNATIGASAASHNVIDVKISGAETYGIPALPAEAQLQRFCTDEKTAVFCTDAGVRRQLSIIVGSKIHDKVKDPKTNAERPRFSVEVALISRIFLARAIETSIRRDSTLGSDARFPVTTTTTKPVEPGSGATADTQKPRPSDTDPPAPGIGVHGGSASNVAIPATVLQRPIVIGFKSVRWIPSKE